MKRNFLLDLLLFVVLTVSADIPMKKGNSLVIPPVLSCNSDLGKLHILPDVPKTNLHPARFQGTPAGGLSLWIDCYGLQNDRTGDVDYKKLNKGLDSTDPENKLKDNHTLMYKNQNACDDLRSSPGTGLKIGINEIFVVSPDTGKAFDKRDGEGLGTYINLNYLL